MKTVTLVIVDNVNHELAKFSIEQTLQNVNCRDIVVFSDYNFYPCTKFIPIKKQISLYDYSDIVVNHLWLYVETEYALVIQWDGMAVDKSKWTDEFLNYDYIGAPWDGDINGNRVGNGGFSLRSKKLIEALRDTKIQLGGVSGQNEDAVICGEFKEYLEKQYSISYSPYELAKQFAIEGKYYGPSLGFHGIWNSARYFSYRQLEYIIQHMPTHIWKTPSKYYPFFSLLQARGFRPLVEFSMEQIKNHN